MKLLRDLDRDTRRARLLAARRKPIGGVNRSGILNGSWDGGNFVGQYRGGRGSFVEPRPIVADAPQTEAPDTSGERHD